MRKVEEQELTDILIELTNTIGYNSESDKHKKAYMIAFNRIKELIEKIDSAERL